MIARATRFRGPIRPRLPSSVDPDRHCCSSHSSVPSARLVGDMRARGGEPLQGIIDPVKFYIPKIMGEKVKTCLLIIIE